MAVKEELLRRISDAIVDLNDDGVVGLCQDYLEESYDALDGIMLGLIAGMNRVSQLFDEGEFFVTDVLIAGEAMKKGIAVLRPYVKKDPSTGAAVKVVMGTVEGDTHDLGKNIVKILLEAAGFETYDLGNDVELEKFADAAIRENAQVIMMTALMTTILGGMRIVIQDCIDKGIRDKVKIIVGGAAVSPEFAHEIGADGYAVNATDTVALVKRLTAK